MHISNLDFHNFSCWVCFFLIAVFFVTCFIWKLTVTCKNWEKKYGKTEKKSNSSTIAANCIVDYIFFFNFVTRFGGLRALCFGKVMRNPLQSIYLVAISVTKTERELKDLRRFAANIRNKINDFARNCLFVI